MQLKNEHKKTLLDIALRTIWQNKWIGRGLVVLILILCYTGGLFYLERYLERTGMKHKIKAMIDFGSIHLIGNYIKGLNSRPDHIYIDVKHTDYQKLAFFRKLALERYQITDDLKEWVPGQIRHNGKTYKVKLRLKGQWVDHVNTSKWSFRIKLKGNKTLFGMKRFSIQHPGTRSYIYEWLYHKMLKGANIVSLRYDFIDVTLNGKDLGVYALEEHFDKRLIENNRQREGVIVHLSDNYHYNPFHNQIGYSFLQTGIQEQLSSPLKAYDEKRILSDSILRDQFIRTQKLFQAFRNKELSTHKVFDSKKLANYFAISELVGALAAPSDWRDMRFYYNPITTLLEPVGVEGVVRGPIDNILGAKRSIKESGYNFHDLLFSDEVFYRDYIRSLEEVSKKGYIEGLLHELQDEMDKKLEILYKEFPYAAFKHLWLYQNQNTIKAFLNPAVGIHAHLKQRLGKGVLLEIANIQYMPVEVLGVYIGNRHFLPSLKPIILSSKKKNHPLMFKEYAFVRPKDLDWSPISSLELSVQYRILGSSQFRKQQVFNWPIIAKDFSSRLTKKTDPNTNKFPFIAIDKEHRVISIKPGDWNINENIIVQAGYQFRVHPGTKLQLDKHAKIISYSPLYWVGSLEMPIVVSSKGTGGGLVVLKASASSLLKNVTFDGLDAPVEDGWHVTGAITFFESPVNIMRCSILNSRSQDSLNIVRSDFLLEDVLFEGSKSDALDCDFSNGKILRTSFVKTGNDAIDISGSTVYVEDIFINKTGDKGLSIGEIAHLDGTRIIIQHSEIGITSKDLSTVELQDLTILHSRLGFAVFQKKPEFGPGSIIAKRVTSEDIEEPYLLELGSSMTLEGKEIAPNYNNLKSILYGVKYGKSSKQSP